MDTKTQSNGTSDLGSDVPPITVENVQKWLSRDLGACITMLHAVHNDMNLQRLMAEHLCGVYNNAKQHNNGIKDAIAKHPKAAN